MQTISLFYMKKDSDDKNAIKEKEERKKKR
jgi:hypothetical protein